MRIDYVEPDTLRQAVAEQHTAVIIYNLVVGRPVDAVAAVERCRAELDKVGEPLTRHTALQDLFADRHQCQRSLNALEEKLKAWTLQDLLDVDPARLASIPSIGPVELAKLLQAVIQRLPVIHYGRSSL